MIKKLISIASLSVILLGLSPALADSHVIQSGETLTSIARQYKTSVNAIVIKNNVIDPDKIYAGDILDVEGEGSEVLGGAGYTPVTGYQSRTTAFISASVATIPVASTKDKGGNPITIGDISVSSTAKVYMSLGTGTSKEEIVYCTGVTTVSWTGCVRGLSFQGGSLAASTTLAFTHNAGTPIIITDVGQFFNEYVSISGDQSIFDVKTFNSFPKVTSTTAVPNAANQLATKYYVDNVGAGGFTSSNVSSTGGIAVSTAGSPACPGPAACISLNASSTGGLIRDSSGLVSVNTSSTGGVATDSLGRVYVDQTDNFNFTGTVTTTGALRVATPSNANDAIPLVYLNTQLNAFSATGTAAVAVTAGQALYATATSSIGVIDTTTGTSTYAFIGIARTSAALGAEVSYTRPGGINCSQSSLQSGTMYYLSGSAGQIATTAGAVIARVALALSATCVQVVVPKYIAYGTISLSGVAGASTNVTTLNFFPANVRFKFSGVTGSIQSGVGIGWGISDDAGVLSLSTSASFPDRSSNAAGSIYSVRDATDVWHGTITKSATGFTITNVHDSGAATLTLYLQYTAESL